MRAFWIALSNEILKQKGTPTIDTLLFLPALIVFLFTMYLAGGAKNFASAANPWLHYYGYALYVLSVVLPLLAAFLGYHLQDIEVRASGYVRAFLFPVSKFTLYLAKAAFALLILAGALLGGFLLIVSSGKLLDWWLPEFGFRDFDSIPVIAAFFIRLLPFLLSIALLHFWIGFFTNNLLVSLGITLILLVSGAFLGISTRYFWLFPGSWLRNAELTVNISTKEIWMPWVFTDVFWALGIFLLGAWAFTRGRGVV